jgi:regulator of CtrA degradation
MSKPVSMNQRIIEALYCEALALSDEVRHAFTLSGQFERACADEDLARVALSSEGLRTTTRMMHAIAWLLNHRAYFQGEISEYQLHRHGRLSPDMRQSDPQQMAVLEPEIAALVQMTRNFYDRLLRLDRSWLVGEHAEPSAIERLRERIEQRLSA